MTLPSNNWSKAGALVATARKLVGTTEKGGDNKGPLVEQFQKAVDGKAQGEPWCMGFVQFCIDRVEEIWRKGNLPGLHDPSRIFESEHCLTVWNKTPPAQRLTNPERGALMLWQHCDAAGNPTAAGHVGIVIDFGSGDIVTTVEGNTGPSADIIEREGDGVYIKKRGRNGTKKMRVLGYLRVW